MFMRTIDVVTSNETFSTMDQGDRIKCVPLS